MKAFKTIVGLLLLVFIIIQFFPKDLPDNVPADESDLLTGYDIPGEVAMILRNSCYDCHSNQVNYPWYSYVAPTAWLVAKDVREARDALNFSEWDEYSIRNIIGIMDDISNEVESGEMPMPLYTLIHRKAKISGDQVEEIIKWSEEYTESILD